MITNDDMFISVKHMVLEHVARLAWNDELDEDHLDALVDELIPGLDDAGSIGKRYRREDEIGTPLCVTVDFQTVGDDNTPADNCVTVRDRDTMEQVRIPIAELKDYIEKKCFF